MKKNGDIQGLINFLEDNSQDALKRSSAASALGELGDSRAEAPLIRILIDANLDRSIHSMAAIALGKLRSLVAVQSLAAMLVAPHTDTSIRSSAIFALEAIGGQDATQALITFLFGVYSTDEYTCKGAIYALQKIGVGDPRTVDALVHVMNGENMGLTLTAATALGRMGDKRAVDPLLNLLSNRSLEGRGYHERRKLVESALKKLGVDPKDIGTQAIDRRWQFFLDELRTAIAKLPVANPTNVKYDSNQHPFHGIVSTQEEVYEQVVALFSKARNETSFHDPRVEYTGESFRAIFFWDNSFDGLIVYKTSDDLPNRYLLLRAPVR